jgi:hypothetical protein
MARKLLSLFLLGSLARRLAFGYVDPNIGGMVFQILAVAFGLITGLLLFFSARIKLMVARIRRYWRERRGTDGDTTPA